jgi:hypothetical protein
MTTDVELLLPGNKHTGLLCILASTTCGWVCQQSIVIATTL